MLGEGAEIHVEIWKVKRGPNLDRPNTPRISWAQVIGMFLLHCTWNTYCQISQGTTKFSNVESPNVFEHVWTNTAKSKLNAGVCNWELKKTEKNAEIDFQRQMFRIKHEQLTNPNSLTQTFSWDLLLQQFNQRKLGSNTSELRINERWCAIYNRLDEAWCDTVHHKNRLQWRVVWYFASQNIISQT